MAQTIYADIPYTPGSDVMPVYANSRQIAGWGSSSIEGMYLVLGSYASSVGAEYFHEGKGIERAEHSFARLGSRPALLTFQGNTVPASGTVEVECSNVAPSIYMKHFEGEVGGVVGTLSVLTAGVFSFARKEAGEPVYVEPDSPFIPTVGTELRNAVTLLWAGKNDLTGNLTPPEEIIKMTDQAFEYHAALHKRVLVLTHFVNSDVPPVNATRSRIQMVNDQIRRRYGAACIDVDLYLRSEQLWVDTGITPTPEDLAQQAAGNKPMSVSHDNGHLSSIGYQAVMDNLIEPRLSELGWYNMGEQ